jgi:ISXO2-like transposase domain
LAGVNRKTAAYFFHRLRQIIARQLEDSLPVEGLVEVDESYFGGVRKGKRGRGAAGKIPVFGILKRGGKVHTSAKTRSCPSSGTRSFRIRLSIPTLIPPMTFSTSPSPTTTGSTTQTPMFSIAPCSNEKRSFSPQAGS